jgi:hypothetical protein
LDFFGDLAPLAEKRAFDAALAPLRRSEWVIYAKKPLAAHEFIRRFLLHVLPSGFHRIRHYGLLAGAVRARRVITSISADAPQPPASVGSGRYSYAVRLTSPCVSKAHAILAILLASATAASLIGLRAISLPIQLSEKPGSRRPHRIAERAPVTNKRRIVRSPIFVIRPRRSFPPLEFCLGTRPSHAAKSRPERKP